jgi:hypothetical protein
MTRERAWEIAREVLRRMGEPPAPGQCVCDGMRAGERRRETADGKLTHDERSTTNMDKLTLTEREDEARKALGFSEADVLVNPHARGILDNTIAFEERAAAQSEWDDAVNAIATEYRLDPNKYAERCQIFTILARKKPALLRRGYGRAA